MTAENRELVVEVARAIVATVDPTQEKFLDADAEAYFADPESALSTVETDTSLGSGWELLEHGLTIIALFVGQRALDVGAETAIEGVLGRIRRGRRKPKTPDLPALTPAQTEKIRKSVIAAAGEQGLDPTVADNLAQAVVQQFSEPKAKD
jgi:hypothetical protein